MQSSNISNANARSGYSILMTLTTDRKLEYLFLSKVRHSPTFKSNRDDFAPFFLVVTIILYIFVVSKLITIQI
nr:MAG TPA: hypothetical protein [Caudoviricetes sp.]